MGHVAGILDPYGGLRVIVGTESEMFYATRCDERCFFIDGMEEGDPPQWERIPYIVHTIEREISWWISTRNDPDYSLPLCDIPVSRWAELMPVKLYEIKSRKTDRKRVLNIDDIVMG